MSSGAAAVGMGPLARRFPALRHPNFRRYAVGQSVSLVGFWMQNVAQGWLVYRISESELVLGIVAFLAHLPMLVLSPVAGVVADRVDKYRLILCTQATAMALATTLGLLVLLGHESVPLVAAAAIGLGLVGAFDLPARQAFLIDLVGPADLPGAIALNASVFNTARVVGPAAAGLLVGWVGEAPCFLLNGVSYLAALWAIAGMRFAGRRVVHPSPELRRSVRSGLAYIRSERAVRALLVALGFVSAFTLQAQVLMPSLAKRVFGAGPEGYGSLLTAFGLGAVLSALSLAATSAGGVTRRQNVLWGLAIFGAGLLGVATSPRIEVALAAQVVAGLGMIRFTAVTNAWIQVLVDDAYRGRVMGIHTVMFAGMAPFGSLLLGAMAEALGPRPTIVLCGTVALLVAVGLRRALTRAGV